MLPVFCLLAALVLFFALYGGFKPIHFKTKICGGELLIYKECKGDYRKTGSVMDEIYYALLDKGIETTLGCGIFYDDPRHVPREELRSEAGCLLPEQHYDKLEKLGNSFRKKELTRSEYLCTEFPYRNQFSILMASFKVYPALEKYLKKHEGLTKSTVIEIYDQEAGLIYYRISLEKNNT